MKKKPRKKETHKLDTGYLLKVFRHQATMYTRHIGECEKLGLLEQSEACVAVSSGFFMAIRVLEKP